MDAKIWFTVWAVVAILVYLDARKRKLNIALTWGIITFLLGILGLAGYLIWVVKPNKRQT